jgi:hypothetical protein
MHVLSDANGLPLLVGTSAANLNASRALTAMVMGHQTRPHPIAASTSSPSGLTWTRRTTSLAAGKGLRGRTIGVRIAREGIGTSTRLGRRRWVIERTMSWSSG